VTPQIDPVLWRAAMGQCLSGVGIVTTMRDRAPVGTAVNAYCAVSLVPSLLLVCLARESRTLAAIREVGIFCLNVLSEEQRDLVKRFAARDETDRFADVSYVAGESGSPILAGALSVFDCSVHEIFDGGDHEIVVGRALMAATDDEAAPLAYQRGELLSLRNREVDRSSAIGASGKAARTG